MQGAATQWGRPSAAGPGPREGAKSARSPGALDPEPRKVMTRS